MGEEDCDGRSCCGEHDERGDGEDPRRPPPASPREDDGLRRSRRARARWSVQPRGECRTVGRPRGGILGQGRRRERSKIPRDVRPNDVDRPPLILLATIHLSTRVTFPGAGVRAY